MTADVLYGQSEWLILFLLIGLLLFADEAGYRLGRRRQDSVTDLVRAQLGSIQGALFGLFALLLGFTFAMALSRFDRRYEMVVQEANAIGTAALRAHVLPPPQRTEMTGVFRRYVDVRVEAGRGANLLTARRRALDAEAARLQGQLWRHAVAAAETDPRSVPVGLLLQSVNEAIDIKEERDAVLANHVPESVLLLLFGFAILTSGVLGFGTGLAGGRALGMAAIFTVLVSVAMLVIVDLDRPGRGLVRVGQESMLTLQRSLNASR